MASHNCVISPGRSSGREQGGPRAPSGSRTGVADAGPTRPSPASRPAPRGTHKPTSLKTGPAEDESKMHAGRGLPRPFRSSPFFLPCSYLALEVTSLFSVPWCREELGPSCTLGLGFLLRARAASGGAVAEPTCSSSDKKQVVRISIN